MMTRLLKLLSIMASESVVLEPKIEDTRAVPPVTPEDLQPQVPEVPPDPLNPQLGDGGLSTETSDTLEDLVEEGSPASSIIKALVEKSRQIQAPIPRGDNLLAVSWNWWMERSLLTAAKGAQYRTRYPGSCSYGVTRYDVDYTPYTAANPRVATVVRTYWGRLKWMVSQDSTLLGFPLSWSPAIGALENQAPEDQIKLIGSVARMRAPLFDGNNMLTLATLLVNRPMTRGLTPLVLVLRLLGYAITLTMPADNGLNLASSIPADSPLTRQGNFDPFGQNTAAFPPVCCVFWSVKKLALWITTGTGITGRSPADVDSSIIVVPAPRSWLHSVRVLAWVVLVHMNYPFARYVRTGHLRDWREDLTLDGAAPGPAWAAWMATSNMVSIVGVPSSVAKPLVVIFVETETSMHDLTLTIPVAGAAAAVSIALDQDLDPTLAVPPNNAAPYLADTLNHLIDREEVATALFNAQEFLAGYYGAERVVRDALGIWTQAMGLKVPSTAFSTDSKDTFPAPPACPENWVSAEWIREADQAYWSSFLSLHVNALGMYPAVEKSVATLGDYLPNGDSPHWEIPSYDSLLGFGLAARLLVYADTPDIDEPILPLNLYSLPATLFSGSYNVMMATDWIFMANAIPRAALLFLHDAGLSVHRTRAVKDLQLRTWGKKGLIPDAGSTSLANVMTHLHGSSRYLIWYPYNGVMTQWASKINSDRHPDVNLALFDFTTLRTHAQSGPLLNTAQDMDLRPLLTDQVYAREGNPHIRDLVITIPSPISEWEKAWNLATTMESLAIDPTAVGSASVFRWALTSSLGQQHRLTWNAFSPLEWAGLLSAADSDMIVRSLPFNPLVDVDEGTTHITGGRPLPSWSSLAYDTTSLLVRSRGYRLAPVYASWKLRWYTDAILTPWQGTGPNDLNEYRKRCKIRI